MPHDTHHSRPASSCGHSKWPVAARYSLVDVVVGVEVRAHEVECVVLAHDRSTAQGCRARDPRQNECAPYVTTNLHH
jgi:hypothetical protein